MLILLVSAVFCLASNVASLPRPQDFVVVEAVGDDFIGKDDQEPRHGRLVLEDVPVDASRPGQAGFRLPLPSGRSDPNLEAVIVEVGDFDDSAPGFEDIPTDRSRDGEAGFKLPRPQDETTTEEGGVTAVAKTGLTKDIRIPSVDEDDFVVVEANFDDEYEFIQPELSRTGIIDDPTLNADIPRDHSGLSKAGFRLPLPDDQIYYDDSSDDLAVVIEAASEDETRGRSDVFDIPRDHSGLKKAGVRLPLPDDQIIFEA